LFIYRVILVGGKTVGLGGFVNEDGTHFLARVNFTGDFLEVSKYRNYNPFSYIQATNYVNQCLGEEI